MRSHRYRLGTVLSKSLKALHLSLTLPVLGLFGGPTVAENALSGFQTTWRYLAYQERMISSLVHSEYVHNWSQGWQAIDPQAIFIASGIYMYL